MDGDSNANFLRSVVVTKIKFRTPIDINQQGDMAFTTLKDSQDFQTIGEFTGYYYPIKVVSSFANNRFTQDITLIRYKTGAKEEGRTQNKELVATNTIDEISQEAGEGIVAGQIGAYDGS